MWHLEAVRQYQGLVFILILVQIVNLSVLGVWMMRGLVDLQLAAELQQLLRISILVVSGLIVIVVGYTTVAQRLNAWLYTRHDAQYHVWMRRWAQMYVTGEWPAHVPLNRVVTESYLDFLKSSSIQAGNFNPALTEMMRWYWRTQKADRRELRLLIVIEALGWLGDAEDLEFLLAQTTHKRLDVRMMSFVAFARLVAQLPPSLRDQQTLVLATRLKQTTIPAFGIEEIFTLMQEAGAFLKSSLLAEPDVPDEVLIALLHTIQTHYDFAYLDILGDYLSHPNAQVRQIVLQIFAQAQYIPRTVFNQFLYTIFDEEWQVREQALRVMSGIPLHRTRLPLWMALGDAEWAVRYAATCMLATYGEDGVQVLRTASIKHQNLLARQIAAQMLSV